MCCSLHLDYEIYLVGYDQAIFMGWNRRENIRMLVLCKAKCLFSTLVLWLYTIICICLCVLGHNVKQIYFSTSLKKRKGLKVLYPCTRRACLFWHTSVHTFNLPFSSSFHDLLVRTLCFLETTLTATTFTKLMIPSSFLLHFFLP